MLSALSRGYSSWNGDLDIYGEAIENTALPEVGPGEDPDRHRHGVTITPRTATRSQSFITSSTPSYPSTPASAHSHPHPPPSVKDDGCLDLPKTFLTRKGALLLFTAPDAPPEKDHVIRRRVPRKRKQQELIDLSLKLGTLERLSMSVLQYGDQSFDRENSSVTDKENRWFLKFLHHLNPPEPVVEKGADPLTDHRAQPGADLNFYLHDLKQRASSRCHGRESSLSSRARSQELREILQQLEEAWPTGHSQPLSQAPTSFTDGSLHGADEFLYPRSPSLSSESSRTFSSRAKVLSSHKLTASLKSLNYLGRPPSTDPGEQTRCITSPDPAGHMSHTRRSKSGYWSGTADPGTEQRRRSGSAQHGARRSSGAERPLATTPELPGHPQDEERNFGSQAICVQVSSPLGWVVDGSERVPMGSVVEEEGEMDRNSMSSSLQQEDEILLPSDGEDGEVDSQRRGWTNTQVDGQGLAKPLQPQYSGVLHDSEMVAEGDEEKLRKSEQGSRPGSRAGSVASLRSREVYRPSSVMSSRAASRAGTLPEEEEVDQEGLDELMAQGSEPDQVEKILLDHATQQLEKQEKYAASYAGSVDRPEPDPETLISMHGGIALSSSSVKSGSDTHNESLQRVGTTPEPRLLGTPEPRLAGTPEPSITGTPEPSIVVNEVRIHGTPEPRIAGTPEPRIAGTPEPRVAGTPEPRNLATPEPRSATPASAFEAKTASRATTPEPSMFIEVKTAEGDKPTNQELAPVNEVAPATALASSITEGMEVTSEGKDSDATAMAMSEAGFGVVPAGLLPSRSASPALSGVAAPSSPVPEQTASQPDKPVPSPLVAAQPQPAKTPAVAAKTEVKTPQTTSRKPAPSQQKAPPKAGAKVEKKPAGGKTYVKAMDITSAKTDQAAPDGAAAAAPTPKTKETPQKKPKESYRPPPPPPRVKTPADKQSVVIPDHMKEAMQRSNSMAQNELENELMQMHKAMEESLGMPTRINEEGEGLTEEELQQAEQALKERMEEAQRKMQEALLPDGKRAKSPTTPKKAPEAKPKKGKKVRVEDPKVAEERAKKEAAKEQRRLEREKRLEEAKALQDLISQKEQQRKAKEEEAARKAKELEEQVEFMKAEEEAIQQAEEDARDQMAALRKTQREEREARRKADMEKKKQDALARREKEKKMMEEARKKEQEMLDRIADAEMRRAIREEEERKRDEEERLAQERYEEELREAQLQAEEEERRLQELERQAEEEAFQRIIAEREEAERQREELELQAKRMAEEEERQRQLMLEEEKRLEEERLRNEAEEQKRKEEEKQRLKELQRLEEEAREKMRAEIERRREWALKRREVNLDRRKNLDGLRQKQGVSEAWITSYFVHWPRETYGRPMGVSIGDKKKMPAKKK